MKARPIIVVILTLIIGFVLGMLTSAQLRIHRLKPVRVFFSEDRFREGFYKAIQPDEKQKVVIGQILDKYARINSELQGRFRREFDNNMKDFRREMGAVLTKDQIARLKALDERRQEMIRRRGNDTTGRRNDHWRERPFRGIGHDNSPDSLPADSTHNK